ncbi:transposase [Micromonospora sp. DPT]|uniref:transposase n=1 Tax=Micromonospora sp. DPT TaxID=3142975 RepID=UPI003207C2BD
MAAGDTAAVAKNGPGGPAEGVDADLVAQLVEQARAAGLQLTGDGGLLQQLTKRVLESALEGEITDHLGYDKGDPAGKNGGNSRNGVRAKTVLTDVGPVEIDVPRDREGSFAPQIVKKRQRRLSGVDDMVISLSAKGLTTGEIQAHLAEVYGADVSRQTISYHMDHGDELKRTPGIPESTMDEDTARRFQKKFPEAARLVTDTTTALGEMHRATLASNDKSQDQVMREWQAVGAAIDTQLQRDDLDPDQRDRLIDRRFRAAERLAEADGRNKAFLDRLDHRKTLFAVALAGTVITLAAGGKAIFQNRSLLTRMS